MVENSNNMPPLPEGSPDWLSAWMQMVKLSQQYLGTLVAVGNVTFPMLTASGRAEPVLPPPDIVSLMTQQIIIPGSPTAEGMLVKAVSIGWFEIIKILKKDWTVAFQIPWRKWEEIIAGAYERAGFEVELTPPSGDHGRDLIAKWKKGGWVGQLQYIGQVKAYKPGHLVTREECSSLLGVMSSDRAVSKGFLTTTSDFAPRVASDPSIAPFIPTRLELINGKQLQAKLAEFCA